MLGANGIGANNMKILNLQTRADIEQGKAIKLNLGSGPSRKQGLYSLDHLELEGVDILADLNEPLDLLPDNCTEYVYSRHALEHIQNFLPLMRELHRITKPGGRIEVVVPHFSNPYFYSDPTHVRFFGLYTMYYFVGPSKQPGSRKVPSFYSDIRFDIESIHIEFYGNSLLDKVVAPFMLRFVNHSISFQDFYERRLCHLFHAWQIRYVMRPEK